MFFSIDQQSEIAIYEQLIRQVQFAVAEGVLAPGQLLPSVRLISQQLAVNPNTINRAFQQLQADGVLTSVRGKGIAVCAGAKKQCVKARRAVITSGCKSVITEAFKAGFSEHEIIEIVQEQICALRNDHRSSTVSQGSDSAAEEIGADPQLSSLPAAPLESKP